MALVSPTPSSGFTPTHADKYSIQSELRKRDEEYKQISQENYDMRLKLYHLERRANGQHLEPRRVSASPRTENFYDFEKDDDTHLSSELQGPVDTEFDDGNPIVEALKSELLKLRDENRSLVERTNELEDYIDDLEDKTNRQAQKAKQEVTSAHTSMQQLVNQLEDTQSENLKSTVELTQARENLDFVKREIELVKTQKSDMEQRENACRARAEGLQMQLDVTLHALHVQRKAAEAANEKMGGTTIELRRVAKELDATKEAARKVEEQRTEEMRVLELMRAELDSLTNERDSAQASLKAEKERELLRAEAGGLVQSGNFLLSGTSNVLEELVSLLRRQAISYDTTEEYSPSWRDRVVEDMNECLCALYRSQREVEDRREQFVEAHCFSQSSSSTVSAVRSS